MYKLSQHSSFLTKTSYKMLMLAPKYNEKKMLKRKLITLFFSNKNLLLIPSLDFFGRNLIKKDEQVFYGMLADYRFYGYRF